VGKIKNRAYSQAEGWGGVLRRAGTEVARLSGCTVRRTRCASIGDPLAARYGMGLNGL
jgi:hypothetical protein